MEHNIFDELYSLSDAAAIWDKADATIRQGILRGKFVDGVDCKKFGKQWVITRESLVREYGEPKETL